jgi:hypothetical protein
MEECNEKFSLFFHLFFHAMLIDLARFWKNGKPHAVFHVHDHAAQAVTVFKLPQQLTEKWLTTVHAAMRQTRDVPP